MNIIVNKNPLDTSSANLVELAVEMKLPANGVAIAVDNKMIPRSEWAEFALTEGRQITILKAFCGG